jgi:alpha-glucosidase
LRIANFGFERLSKPATIAGTIISPRRVVIAGRTLNALVNADIVHNLAPPPDRALFAEGIKTPWIRPGRFGERRKDTSWAQQIATAAVFTSPVLVFGGHPQSLLDNPAVELLESLPRTWDETIVLPASEIGELAVMARRKGRTWFVAVLNGPTARSLRIDLGFLGKGRYDALVVRDTSDDPAAVIVEKTRLMATTPPTAD